MDDKAIDDFLSDDVAASGTKRPAISSSDAGGSSDSSTGNKPPPKKAQQQPAKPQHSSINLDVSASAGNPSDDGFVPETPSDLSTVGAPYTVRQVREAGKIPVTLTYPDHLVFPLGQDAREQRHEEMWKVVPCLWPLTAAMFAEHRKLSGTKSVHVKEELGQLDKMGLLKPIWDRYQSEEARAADDGRAFRAAVVAASKDCRLVAGAMMAFRKANPQVVKSAKSKSASKPEHSAKKPATPRTSFYLRVFGVDEALEGGRATLDLPTWDKVAAAVSIAMFDVSLDTPTMDWGYCTVNQCGFIKPATAAEQQVFRDLLSKVNVDGLRVRGWTLQEKWKFTAQVKLTSPGRSSYYEKVGMERVRKSILEHPKNGLLTVAGASFVLGDSPEYSAGREGKSGSVHFYMDVNKVGWNHLVSLGGTVKVLFDTWTVKYGDTPLSKRTTFPLDGPHSGASAPGASAPESMDTSASAGNTPC